jgi:Nucleotidyltransferase of unknown function (DUF6036)
MLDIANADQLERLLDAVAQQLARAGQHYELVVVGGSALLALGLIDRPTKDVDVIAFRDAGVLQKADPLPAELREARDRVARDFGLQEEWINPGPASLVDLGLYALVDQGAGRHEQDLHALNPTAEELVRAARWTRTHDPSPGFRQMLEQALRYLGVADAGLGA